VEGLSTVSIDTEGRIFNNVELEATTNNFIIDYQQTTPLIIETRYKNKPLHGIIFTEFDFIDKMMPEVGLGLLYKGVF